MYQPNIPQNQKTFQWFIFPWFWGMSKLPWFVLDGVSGFVYFILYRVLKYRLKVVRTNLENAFPQSNPAELKGFEEGYYHHLSDLFIETIKGNDLSANQIKKFIQLENKELLDSFYQNGKSALIVLSHSGNWEWSCLAASQYTNLPFYVVYKPLSNEGFNAYFYKMRSKFGALPISMNETLRMVSTNLNQAYLLAMVGDQNPGNINNVHWKPFLNQETAFLNGPAKIAERFKLPVIYLKSKKTKRHHYTLIPELIVDWNTSNIDSNKNQNQNLNLNQYPNQINPEMNWNSDTIMNRIIQCTESEIMEQPEIWLWSHRRWKHKRN